jgi:hypothetical protein
VDTTPAWARCNGCKGDIDFDEVYYVCSVSTCNRKGNELRFCSVECWDVHVPVMRHREAWAEEKRSPSREQWERENPPAPPTQQPSTSASAIVELSDAYVGRDILVVVSKLKAYVRARSGMNTSDTVMEVLSDRLRALCDEGIRRAASVGRKTLMDRDFK